MKISTNSTRIEGKGQFVTYIEHLDGGPGPGDNQVLATRHKLRLKVDLGGTPSQSHGSVERWTNTAGWVEVAFVAGSGLYVDCNAGYGKLSPTLFAADRDKLIRLAKEVLE